MERKRMREIMADAKKRRESMLEHYNRLIPITMEEFGLLYGLTGQRAWQIINKAQKNAS